jgi:catechol 2,3-dioxygenase-like lactoylglutathione lyase family enzyme
MLNDAELVAFLATLDLEAANASYESLLGLPVIDANDFAVVYDANGTQLRVTKVDRLQTAPFTVLGWRVENIFERVAALRSGGVPAMRYDGMQQDDDGVWIAPSGTRVAWFKDPDGHTLSLQQEPAA